MSKEKTVTVDVDGIERALRRMIAAKEVIDAAIESVAELLVQARPQSSDTEGKPEMPATFGSRPPAERATDIPGWQAGVTEETKG